MISQQLEITIQGFVYHGLGLLQVGMTKIVMIENTFSCILLFIFSVICSCFGWCVRIWVNWKGFQQVLFIENTNWNILLYVSKTTRQVHEKLLSIVRKTFSLKSRRNPCDLWSDWYPTYALSKRCESITQFVTSL